ncbi:TRAPP trafficking subunit Trs65-domain-containing protein [Russula earlei]|uniref:TRAPP trafficking subunit Trs65-domain-containing protein n=1 Tax=Russula earlei TaxID=71964 RepID=A0ACC0U2N3_9AGAM|nr:TRAPP trafficking subunit Trs65-domain-containing protein [Russula earlei]
MPTFEQIINSSTLNVIVPNASLEFPTTDIDGQAWLEKLRSKDIERERAFFDECLDFFLVLCLEQPDEAFADPAHPPSALLSFLAHTQVSYEAIYITPAPASSLPVSRLDTMPRTTSLKPIAGNGGLHVPPSIFPPNTPNPTPLTTEQDRRYVRTEGVALVSGIWGEEVDSSQPRRIKDRDAFALLWDEISHVWVAVYRMCIEVAFLRLPIGDPLLCLTASVTVRERPMPMTPARTILATMFREAEVLPELAPQACTELFNDVYESDKFYHGLDEVNLLEGLSSAPTFANALFPLSLPSTRLGAKIRERDFALPSDPPPVVDASAAIPSLAARATLRKSFRRTLAAVSGFRVRMRTVFVPYISLYPAEPDADVDRALAAGHVEHTVMLCVELEHPGEAPEAFLVDAVDVTVGDGGGARVHLLPWCEKSVQEIFPLRLGRHEQCNLLFAVELLNAPMSDKEALLLKDETPAAMWDLQRQVTITVRGQPVSARLWNGDQNGAKTDVLPFLTRPFPSRWNCVLGLAPQQPSFAGEGGSEVLPEPPTPFPTTTPPLSTPAGDKHGSLSAVAGQKRFAPPSSHVLRSPRSFPPFRTPPSGTSRGIIPSSGILSKLAYTPPSVSATAISGLPRTTYAPPSSPGIPPPAPLGKMLPMGETDEAFMGGSEGTTPPPATPAYPAYAKGSTFPMTPRAQAPLAISGAVRFPSAAVELPRSGAFSRPSPVPSPLALVPFSSITPQRERIIVSVGLQDDVGTRTRVVVPYNEFVLDIFVFNQSSWTRRFETTFLERRRRRHGQSEDQGQWYKATIRGGASGSAIVPLESRVRVGPLRPATCQSVRMSFLALVPGVHIIEHITLTDIETQHTLTLRTSIDIVIQETWSPL